MTRRVTRSTLFPYTTLFRSDRTGSPRRKQYVQVDGRRWLCGAVSQYQNARERFYPRLHRRFQQRSEEHTSELQSPDHLVCRLLLEKKKKQKTSNKLVLKTST